METPQQDNNFIFSKAVKAGKRIYYFDVKKARNAETLYLSITESLKRVTNIDDTLPQVVFSKQRLIIHKEDLKKFADALTECISLVNNIIESEPQNNFDDGNPAKDSIRHWKSTVPDDINFDDISFDL